MITKIVTYKVKENCITQTTASIREFVKAIKENEPTTYYSAYQHNKSGRFTHIMVFLTEEDEVKHQKAPYTQKFVDVLIPNCEQKPVYKDMNLIADTE